MESGSVSYSRIAAQYEQARGGDERGQLLAAALDPWVGDGLVCDVGAGTGVVADVLHRSGHNVLACDLSPEMIAQATQRLPGRICVADASALPIRDRSVQTVTYVWVLHHVGDLTAALAEAWRVLGPEGRVVSISGISIPNTDPMSRIFETLDEELRPGRRRQAFAVPTIGGEMGFVLEHEGFVPMNRSISPNELASAIEERLYSQLWDVTDAQWRRQVAPVVEELRALPEPSESRDHKFRYPLVVLRRP